MHTGSSWENLDERNHLEDLDADVKILLKWILKKWQWGMECHNLVQDKDVWQALLNKEMNIQVL